MIKYTKLKYLSEKTWLFNKQIIYEELLAYAYWPRVTGRPRQS